MNKIAIFPGSFDPYTKGHDDIVRRSLTMFDEIYVGIGYNSSKNKRYFDIDYMVEKIESVYVDEPRVKVITYNELTANLAKKLKAQAVVRGLRNTTDFEYENSISQINRHLNDELETIFLITSPEFASVSSTIIREVHKYDGDVSEFLPYTL
ncbi:MAG: pantetheine-phosphate adenylyltransferase [bacterium]|nr:pantetheine-phosphate adenylyltransferase [bacterium]